MKLKFKGNATRASFGAVISAFLLAGCVTTTPSSQSDESDLSGTYTVVDRSRRNGPPAASVEVKFAANEISGGLEGVSGGHLKITGPTVPDSWAWVYPICGYPGDYVRTHAWGDAEPTNIEIIRCMDPLDFSTPVAVLIKTRDGHAFHVSFGPLDPFNKSLDVTTGRLLVISMKGQLPSAYVLKAQ